MAKKSITVLCIGDPHFQENNKIQYDEMSKRVLEVASELKPNYIVIMGDTLHRFKTIHQDPHYDACQFFYALSDISPLYVLIGNHDRRSNEEFMTEKNPFHTINNERITIVSRTLSIDDPILLKKFLFIPYVPKGRFLEAVHYSGNIQFDDVAGAFAHHEFENSEYGGIVSKDGDKWHDNWFFIASGHIHKYSWLRSNILYVGTPMQHTIDETEEKTISLLTFTKGEKIPKEKRFNLHCQRMQKISMSVKEFEKWEHDTSIKWTVKLIDTGSAVKMVQTTKKYRDLNKLGVTFHTFDTDGIEQEEMIEERQESCSYIQLLWKRIEDDIAQSEWLRKILDEK